MTARASQTIYIYLSIGERRNGTIVVFECKSIATLSNAFVDAFSRLVDRSGNYVRLVVSRFRRMVIGISKI